MDFNIVQASENSLYRAGKIQSSRNVIETPCFMPVGTHGAVVGLTPEFLQNNGAEIIVCNALRLSQKPGLTIISKFSDLHTFIGWPRTILTDSGGYQSMASAQAITEQGILFNATDGTELWTPEQAINTQVVLGSDFVMPLDICVQLPAPIEKVKDAMYRTIRWVKRCKRAFTPHKNQILFGILQGGVYPELRQICIDKYEQIGFQAYAIGGLNVGETRNQYIDTLSFTNSQLPQNKIRYLMGIGRPEKMLDAVKLGVDIMDSIIPTKYARERKLFSNMGIIKISDKKRFQKDKYPIDTRCNCYTCQHFSRAFLYHLYQVAPTSAIMYGSIHNVHFCIHLMKRARKAILEHRFEEFSGDFLNHYIRKQ